MLIGLRSRTMITCGMALATCGCVNLEVDHARQAQQFDAPPSTDKPSYFLSKTVLTVTATVTLNDCDGIATSGTLKPGMELTDDTAPIDVTEALSVSAASTIDRSAEYVIPLDRTRSWAKQLNLTIARNPDKTLVSFNGTLADQAGPTILAAAQTAIAIGGAVALPPTAPAIYGLTKVADKAAGVQTTWDLVRTFKKGPNGTLIPIPGPPPQPKPRKNRSIYERTLIKPETRATGFEQLHFCNAATTGALDRIALLERMITKEQTAGAKSPGGKKKASGDAGSSPPPPDPFVVQTQAAIARIRSENNFTRTFTWTWTPERSELKTDKIGRFALIQKEIDLYKDVIAPYWLSPAGVANVEKAAAARNAGRVQTAQATASKLRKPVHIDLMIMPWTIGRNYEEDSLAARDAEPKPLNDAVPEPPTMGGIVYREPASATLRLCQGPCGGQLAAAAPGSLSPENVSGGVTTATDMDNGLLETTADIADLKVPVSQFGKVQIVSMHSKLFETSVASIMQNTDGSISSVGTQSSNAAAAGFAAATAAANAQSSAVAARNTAIGADNTAATAKAQYMDNANKAVADCLTQQAAIAQQGGKPIGQCQ